MTSTHLQSAKKDQQRLHSLCRLDTFNVDNVDLFYKSLIESILTFCLISWYGNLSVQNKNCLFNIVKVARKLIGTQQLSLADISDRQVLPKAQSILVSSDHPFLEDYILLPCGLR